MVERFIPAVFMRGGSSKGVVVRGSDLPADPAQRDRALLAIMGSPDPYGRQLNGMGGGLSSVSKVVIIDPPSRPDADIDYLFAQVAVDQVAVDYGATCGNMASAVGPYAIEQGLVTATGAQATVRINQVNNGKLIHSHFAVDQGRAVTEGDLAIAGVAGTGARIRLDFVDPGGAVTGALLPTGRVVDLVESADFGPIEMTLLDAANAAAFVRAADIGLTGAELPDEIEAIPGLMAKLDRLRRQAGVLMGLAATPDAVGPSNPRFVIVAAPAPFRILSGETVGTAEHDIGVRMLNMGRVHRAIALTSAMAVGVACRIEGTLAHQLAVPAGHPDEIRVGNPSGTISVGAEVRRQDGAWVCDSGAVYRTARTLMRGEVAVP